MNENDSIVRIANLFKQRDNPNNFNITTGVLISKSPIQFRVNDKFIVSNQEGNMIITKNTYNYIISHVNPLGLRFIIIPTPDGSTWYVLEEVM